MKTILLAVAALGLAVSTGFSQGTISFQNPAGAGFVITNGTSTGGGTGKAAVALGTRIQLLYQPDTGGSAPDASMLGQGLYASTFGSWETVGGANSVGPAAGIFGAYTLTTGSDVQGGNNVWLVAVAWSGSYTSLAAAQAGGAAWYGVDTAGVWSQGTGNPAGSPPTTAVSTTPYWTGLVLTPTPEPATIALGGLGAAALLLFRRRK